MLARLDPRDARPDLVPARRADERRDARARQPRAGLAAAERAESQEACFLAGGRLPRSSSSGAASRLTPGPIVDERGAVVGEHEGTGGSRRGSAAGSASSPSGRSTRSARDAGDEHGRRRPPRVARAHGGLRPRAPLRPGRAGGREGALPLARGRGGGRADRPRVPPPARRARLRRRARADRCPLRGRRRRRRRHRRLRSPRWLPRFDWSDLAYLALTIFLVLAGLALGYGALRLGGTLAALLR